MKNREQDRALLPQKNMSVFLMKQWRIFKNPV